MSEKVTRILVTLDCDRLDVDVFRALRAVADRFELTGLYVEDEDLLKASRLPGLREVLMSTGEVKELTPSQMEQQISGQALRARHEFERSARVLNVDYRFQVVRGRPAERVAEAASGSDMVVISRSLRASGLRARGASHFAPLMQPRANLLFVNEPWSSGSVVIALCETSPQACDRALAVARRIADAEGIELLVAAAPQAEGVETAHAHRTVTLDEWSEEAIAGLCEKEDARLLVVPPTEKLQWQQLLLNLVDRVPCSLMRLGD